MLEYHEIGVAPNGQIYFPHHPNFKDEIIFWELGGEQTCYCYLWYKAIRRKEWYLLHHPKISRQLNNYALMATKIHYSRARTQYNEDRLAWSFNRKIERRLRLIILKIFFEKCNYRYPSRKWVWGDVSADMFLSDDARIVINTIDVWERGKRYPGKNLKITIYVKMSWYSRVYKKGLDNIERQLVLDAEELPDGGYKLLIAKQGRGLNIHPAWHIYKDGKLKLIKEQYEPIP